MAAYEDFLESLSHEEQEAVMDGRAYVGDPLEGLREIEPLLKFNDEAQATEYYLRHLAETATTEREGAQIIANLLALHGATKAIGMVVREHIGALHRQKCEKCAARHAEQSALAEFLRSLLERREDDEPWRSTPAEGA